MPGLLNRRHHRERTDRAATFYSILACAIALVLPVVLAVGCKDSVLDPEEPSAYFPLTVGNQWRYAPENPELGEPFQWRVTERVGNAVTLDRPANGSHPGPVTLLDNRTAVDLSLGAGESGPYYRFWPGASWTRRDPWECDDGSSWVTVATTDTITTPAGTFHNVLRLERRSSAVCTDAGTMVEWWARGVGLVRWEELNFYAGGPLTYDLIGFSAPAS